MENNTVIPPKPSTAGLKRGTLEWTEVFNKYMVWMRRYSPGNRDRHNTCQRKTAIKRSRAQGVKPKFVHIVPGAPPKPSTKGLKQGTQEFNDACAARTRWRRLYVPGWKERVNKRSVEYTRNKRKQDVEYALHHNIRCNLSRALRITEETKIKRSLDYVGCTIEQLKNHLASQFNGRFNWDTFGNEWAIDHIVPLASRLPVELTAHYTNLQPLSIKENNAKDCKIIKEYLFKIVAHPDTPDELLDVALSLLSY